MMTYTLMIETVGNPDFGENHTRSLPHAPGGIFPAPSPEAAVDIFTHYRDRHDIGSGNLARAEILRGNTLIARVAYNGRILDI